MTNINLSTEKVRELKDVDLVDGLDISTGQYRAHTSFIKRMEQLLDFNDIRFSCAFRYSSTNYWHDFVTRLNSDAIKYFTGNNNIRPAEGSMQLITNGDFVIDTVDEMLSSNSSVANVEERTFKDILLNKDGFHLTFGNHSKHCFNEEGEFLRFEVYVD